MTRSSPLVGIYRTFHSLLVLTLYLGVVVALSRVRVRLTCVSLYEL